MAMELGGQLMGASLGVFLNPKWKMGMQLAGSIEKAFMHQHCNICCGILSPTSEFNKIHV